jgi:hypothetical protein
MVAATPTPGYGCSGRPRDASEISLGVQQHVAAFLQGDMSPRSKARICPLTPNLRQRASRRNASRELTLPFAPRPRKQKPVGKRFASPVERLTAFLQKANRYTAIASVSLFFVLGVLMMFCLQPYRKQTVGEQILPSASKRQAGRLCSRLISVRFRPARSRGPAHAGPAYDASAHARARRSREKMH